MDKRYAHRFVLPSYWTFLVSFSPLDCCHNKPLNVVFSGTDAKCNKCMTHQILSSWKRRRRIWVKTETNYSPFFKGIFATIYIYFSVQWIVDHCLSLCPLSCGHCIVCDLRFTAFHYSFGILILFLIGVLSSSSAMFNYIMTTKLI